MAAAKSGRGVEHEGPGKAGLNRPFPRSRVWRGILTLALAGPWSLAAAPLVAPSPERSPLGA